MPILPEFLKIPLVSRQVLLTQLGLDPAVVTITISAGSAGGGNMLRIYQALEGIKKKVQIIFVCGKNPKLQLAMDKEIERSSLPTVVLSYADSVADGMNACDLLVTKPGGLTTFEAIARRLPMAFDMVTALMPQESGTADMVIEAQLAKPIRRPEDIVSIVESITIVKDRLNKTLPTEHNLNRVDAVYDIAKTILSYCKSPAELAQTPTMPEQPSV
jgi:UDP-N-acetylglucosamine:LPS N-acetylglucosamine transferase